MHDLYALIMAGGGGTRLWPRSRQNRPKQFLDIGSPHSLLREAFLRIEPHDRKVGAGIVVLQGERETEISVGRISQQRVLCPVAPAVGRDVRAGGDDSLPRAGRFP